LDDKDALLRNIGGARCKLVVTLAQPLASLPAQLAGKVLAQDGEKIELQIDKGRDSIMAVLDSLRAAGAAVTDLKTEQADLEDVFVEIMRRRKSTIPNPYLRGEGESQKRNGRA
jgi:ABC-2 type transport system ATP-binding protein